MKKLVVSFCLIALSWSCATIIPKFAPEKHGRLADSAAALEADRFFWDNFHRGNYDSIPRMLDLLTAAYLDHNTDPRLAAHTGFTHAWALAESERRTEPTARVTDHGTLAVKYFKEGFELSPDRDWRYYGFLVSMYMAEGGIHGDMQDMTAGYFNMKKAVRKYPEFNLFTAAYTLAMSPRQRDRDAAVKMLHKNIEICVGERLDARTLDYRNYLDNEDLNGKMSTCWNTWIAPHNLEGFLLIYGDLLLKQADYAAALNVYRNARYFPEYDRWAYRPQLEDRIVTARRALERQLTLADIELLPVPRCMICHEEKALRPSPDDVHLRLPSLRVGDNLSGRDL